MSHNISMDSRKMLEQKDPKNVSDSSKVSTRKSLPFIICGYALIVIVFFLGLGVVISFFRSSPDPDISGTKPGLSTIKQLAHLDRTFA